ncbi:hypothetical protein RBH29_11150 [Herbivorax sp. ANBcel31]|uniref:hypothetical protein n=1 Tax=Herbivorax sp. ANBcel31 TaxID=3069754 RepID=UPI0027B7BBF2|nr:hypothetical protein [Herbivorax sp. ANBcel31]MDQ2086984.1 hypothetical protein [Herbivorax sp. ANBcel31]
MEKAGMVGQLTTILCLLVPVIFIVTFKLGWYKNKQLIRKHRERMHMELEKFTLIETVWSIEVANIAGFLSA